MAEEAHEKKVWVPLESDPQLLDKFMYGMGVPEVVRFEEVFGLDEELLEMIPRPVHAVLMLFPVSEASEDDRKQQKEKLEAENYEAPKDVFWMKQIVGNACGTIALIHSLANNSGDKGAKIQLEDGKLLAELIEAAKQGEDPAVSLENSAELERQHQEIAEEAQSDPTHSIHDDLHFIAFVNVNGIMYELDGRKSGPIPHGESEDLLLDAVKVAKEFMEKNPEDTRFSLIALIDNQ